MLEQALQQGVLPAIVVAVYLIIIRYIDSKKESNQIKITSNLADSITGINSFLEHITKDIIDKDKEKCKNAIEDSFYSTGMKLINFVSTTIINNHIDINKDTINNNIHNIVNAEYYTIYASLSEYNINDVKVSDILNSDWINGIEKDMTDVIFNTNLNKEDRINSFINKINIKFQSYITYVINKVM